MVYRVMIKKKVEKRLVKLPSDVLKLFYLLAKDLEADGPLQPSWPNYSKLGINKFHCHLKHSWVACWTWTENSIEIEVYYVGSRENAPY